MRACVRECVRAGVCVHVLMCCKRKEIKCVGEGEKMLGACRNAN